MLLDSLTTTRLGILVDLVLDHGGSVRDQDGACAITAAHLRFLALEGGEESRVDRSRLLVLELLGNIARHSEVRVLVDGGRDQAREVSVAEDVWEGV